jgi:endonuclease III
MPRLTNDYQKKDRASLILEKLAAYYSKVKTSLIYSNPFELFVATILSAQTTDEQVNRITAALFSAVPTVFIMSQMKPSELEPYLKSCGLYRHKSRYLVESSRIIVNQYNGRIPDTYEELIKLPGVGRKSANVIISTAFGKPALAVDTHVFRVSKRLGLAEGLTVETVEDQLKKIVTPKEWSACHHRLIAHGRSICYARNPGCTQCFLNDLCLYPQRSDSR